MENVKDVKGVEDLNVLMSIGKEEYTSLCHGLSDLCQMVNKPTTVDVTNLVPGLYHKPIVVLLFPWPYDIEFNFIDCLEYQVPEWVDIIGVHANNHFYTLPAGQWIDHATKRLAELSEEEE